MAGTKESNKKKSASKKNIDFSKIRDNRVVKEKVDFSDMVVKKGQVCFEF